MLGYGEEEITGRNWFDNFVSERTREENRACFSRFMDGQMRQAEYCESVILTKDGEERIIAWNNNLLKDESGGVTGALCSGNDITERRLMEEKLIKEKMFSESIINSLPGTFYLFNEQGMILRWNRNLEIISGYSSEEISNMHPVDFFQGGYKELIVNKVKEVIEKGTAVCEADMVLKNGLKVPFFFVAIKIVIDNKTYVIGTGTDITDRKQAEEQLKCYLRENELLLKEIHHRVKNNLQIICSLFNLQKSSIKDRNAYEMVSECQNRIRAIALVHEKFYNSESLANINLNDYINDLVQNLFHFNEINPNRIRLETAIDNILVDVNSAIPCGLILNELVGNCLQYAFPQERKGRISVSIFLTNSDCVNITVKDNGVDLSGFYDIIEELPLGFQIVNALIKQLKGKMEIIRGDGTEYIITFRLKK
ncbi:MAG: PAS domain S-box protein [Nitrospirota bacterium]|nr:PAS domain S-box protein [Nitrospirota bacterium]